jgi:uncharacterized protein YjbI with pentapeptide repeats
MATITTGQRAITTGQPQIRWQKVWAVLVAVFWVAIVVGIIGGFFLHWSWTGFPENGSLWDWLQLLSAPVFVSALPLVFKEQRNEADRTVAEQQSQVVSGMNEQQTQTDLKVEENRQQAAALEAYQDYILQLMLDRNLRGSQPGSDAREAARARTLAVLRRTQNNRKGDVVQFLYAAGLIYKGKAIVDLREADLSGVELSGAKLNGIGLSGADLRGASLCSAILRWADLSNAQFSEADLCGVDLSEANLTGADFSHARLHEVNLRGAMYTKEQLSSAQSDSQREYPNDKNRYVPRP